MENQFKGTKSPWLIKGKSRIGSICINVNGSSIDVWNDVVNQYGETVTEEEATANAKLISCAPELLEMLQELYASGCRVTIEKSIQIKELITKATTI